MATAVVLVVCMMVALTGRSAAAADELSAKDLFAKVSPSVVRVIAHGQGSDGMRQESGFIIPGMMVVTNHRFLENAKSAEIVLGSGGKRVAVKGFVAEDVAADMVLLSVAGYGKVKPAVLADLRPAVGAKVFFISRPLGRSTGIAPGLVTGFREASKTLSLMDCGIKVPDGSGGGPIFSNSGLVFGAAAPSLGTDKDHGSVVPCDRLQALIGARGKVRPLTELARSPGTTTQYSSMIKALSAIPSKLFPARNVKFNDLQRDMINKWIKENLVGSEILFKGRLVDPPKGRSGGVTINFPADNITVHRKLLPLNVEARFEGSYALELSKLKKGNIITLHGTLGDGQLYNRRYPYNFKWNIRLDNCAPGAFPKPVRRRPPPETKTPTTTASPEKKAGRQLRMAKAYMGIGKTKQARDLLQAIITDYPKTKAAAQAKALLDKTP